MQTYEWGAFGGEAWARAGYHYIGKHPVEFANKPETNNDAQHLLDASLNYQYNQVLVSFYGHNLTNEDGYALGFDAPTLWGFAATRNPRTWGFSLSYRFGDE